MTAASSIAVVGAGVLGRTIAILLASRGHKISIYERESVDGMSSCSFAAAGLLSPVSELEHADEIVYRLGRNSLSQWKRIIELTGQKVFLKDNGSIVISHMADRERMVHFSTSVARRLAEIPEQIAPAFSMRRLDASQLAELEPQLRGRFSEALFIPDEGVIDNRQVMKALETALKMHGVRFLYGKDIEIGPHEIASDGETSKHELIIDARGLSARAQTGDLRGVRGELIELHAPEVDLSHAVRLMHPRYPIYIAPRENRHYLVGATQIESEDMRPVTVQSCLELLSAAFSVHPGFAEAVVKENRVNLRPAFPDNLPRFQDESGVLRINGLFRHGFLLAPGLAELAVDYIESGSFPSEFKKLLTHKETEYANKIKRQESRSEGGEFCKRSPAKSGLST